jgi:hypothetical protein
LAPTVPEERVKMSWVTIDRICQEDADGKEDVRRELVRNGKPLRSSAEPLSDDELLAKLRDLGLDVDRDGWSGSARARCPPKRWPGRLRTSCNSTI